MNYTVWYTVDSIKRLKKMDKYTRTFILSWISKNLVGCSDPRQHGKPLSANRVGQWRYRIGDYRLLAEIDDGKITILIVAVGHRRDIYEK
jgi:mRNA interferase RelE/StbE